MRIRSPLKPSFIALLITSMLTSTPRTTAQRLIRLSAVIERASKLMAAALDPEIQKEK